MASVITSPQYDPIPTAEKLATKAVAGQKAALAAQTALANNTTTALGNLKSAISTFQSAMSAMTSSKSVLSQSATFPTAGYGTRHGRHQGRARHIFSFFVEKLATASQVSYGGLSATPATAAGTGTLKVKIGDGVSDNTLRHRPERRRQGWQRQPDAAGNRRRHQWQQQEQFAA